ncbi:hypothetical protein ACGF15_15040, partial [Streptomyces sp. NPDC048001]
MRSARILIASAAVTAALAVSAPASYALAVADDHGRDEASSSEKKWEKDGDHEKSGEYRKPHGGVHAGGGALAAVSADDWEKKDDEHEKSGKYKKPHGGVHAGGGALAAVSADDWEKKDDEHEKSGKYKKPHGGVH